MDADGEGVEVATFEGVEVADVVGNGASLMDVDGVEHDTTGRDNVVEAKVSIVATTRSMNRGLRICVMD